MPMKNVRNAVSNLKRGIILEYNKVEANMVNKVAIVADKLLREEAKKLRRTQA